VQALACVRRGRIFQPLLRRLKAGLQTAAVRHHHIFLPHIFLPFPLFAFFREFLKTLASRPLKV